MYWLANIQAELYSRCVGYAREICQKCAAQWSWGFNPGIAGGLGQNPTAKDQEIYRSMSPSVCTVVSAQEGATRY